MPPHIRPAQPPDPIHVAAIFQAIDELTNAQQALTNRICDAVIAGANWTWIGHALGVTKQAAWERYSPAVALRRQST